MKTFKKLIFSTILAATVLVSGVIGSSTSEVASIDTPSTYSVQSDPGTVVGH